MVNKHVKDVLVHPSLGKYKLKPHGATIYLLACVNSKLLSILIFGKDMEQLELIYY